MRKPRVIFVVCCLLTLVTLACYWPVTNHKFVSFDDDQYIRDNPHVRAGLTASGLLWAFQSGYASNWHPLTWLSHMADCQLYGLSPAGHHLTSLLFHLANSLLLFGLWRRWTGALWRSALVAALFAWHPLHVESVAWAAERKDVLSTFFFLLALGAYGRYLEARRKKEECRMENAECEITQRAPRTTDYGSLITGHQSLLYLLSLCLFALGLMSKPMVVTLPFVLLLLDFWPFQRLRLPRFEGAAPRPDGADIPLSPVANSLRASAPWQAVREKLPFFALALAASLVTYWVQRAGGAVSSLEVVPWQSRISNAVVVYVRYLSQTLWPADLAFLYPFSPHLGVGSVVGATLLLAGLSAWFLLRGRRQPFLIVGWLWFLGTLVPTIGLVQVGSQSMADRYMYIPSIGLFVLIVWGLDALSASWRRDRRFLATAGALAMVACLICTRRQLTYWQDSESLFRRAIAVTSGNYIAYDGLGSALEALGKTDEALASYSESVRLKPHYPEGQYDLGTALMKLGRLDEAVPHLAAAVKHDPAFAHAHINLGKARLEQGNLDEAVVHLSKAVRLATDDAEAYYNLGTVLLMQTKQDEAVACFSEALRLKPDYGEAHGNLGIALVRKGKLGEGAAHFLAALRLNPDNPGTHYNFGLALLELNRPGEAASHFSETLRLNPDSPGSHYHLALALVRQDKPKEALPHAQKARELALATGQPALAAKAEELLKQHR